VEAKSDATRRQELHQLGRSFGQGHSFGRLDASLPDSILQRFASNGVLPPELQNDPQQRREACERLRAYINNDDGHGDPMLHTLLRDDVGERIVGATDDEHADGPFDYLIHGEVIARLFLEHFAASLPSESRGFKIVVYTRFDCEEFNPYHATCSFGHREYQNMRKLGARTICSRTVRC
jgi:hypothetical protein